MLRRLVLWFAPLLALLGLALGLGKAAAGDAGPVRILFIGNSYTYSNDMPALLRRLAQGGGSVRPVQIEAVTAGGVSLGWHWQQGGAQAALLRQKWDYVVLQDFSTLPLTDPAAVRQAVALFDAEVRRAGAQTVLYLTWARATAPQTQAVLDRVYYGIGNELGARVAPVGPAWALARQADPALRLHESDNSHPTLAGSWLAACVFHITLFGKAPALSQAPQGLTAAQHRTLLSAAIRATSAKVSGGGWRPLPDGRPAGAAAIAY